jgi:hypothetical protein
MTISEQEAYAATLVVKGSHYIGMRWERGELKEAKSFSSKFDAEQWYDSHGPYAVRLYAVYRPFNKPAYTKLSYAK